MRIGLLGGSFDPVHCAHLALANTALAELKLDQVQLIPAGQPWQRLPLLATSADRLEMLRRATEGMAGLHVSTVEIDRNGPTYTIETLDSLPVGPQYFWILGADQLANFCTWHRWTDIVSRVQLVVAQRPGSELIAPPELATWLQTHQKRLIHLPFQPLAVSASEIRQGVAQGATTAHLLPEAVALYITAHGLYRQHTS
jgi:nicotinate-nucleotide adenylyltransferase